MGYILKRGRENRLEAHRCPCLSECLCNGEDIEMLSNNFAQNCRQCYPDQLDAAGIPNKYFNMRLSEEMSSEVMDAIRFGQNVNFWSNNKDKAEGVLGAAAIYGSFIHGLHVKYIDFSQFMFRAQPMGVHPKFDVINKLINDAFPIALSNPFYKYGSLKGNSKYILDDIVHSRYHQRVSIITCTQLQPSFMKTNRSKVLSELLGEALWIKI